MAHSSTSTRITVTTTAEVDLRDPLRASPGGKRRFSLVISCDGRGEVAPLKRNATLVVGRGFPSQVQLEHPSVSRQHARFIVRDDQVTVEDLASRNGTYVNGERVAKADLSPGDEVRIGAAVITLAATRAADGARSSAARTVIIENDKVKAAYTLARRAAQTDLPVLILGETGTGKEHLATTIHSASARMGAPFKVINCGAIPDKLTESLLFGHERGAFTGADRRTLGVFEEAAGGVVFLDEVGELARGAQAALLRVLETKRLSRVGGVEDISVDVRVVAATHCDLAAMVEEKTFRRDLFYRLNTVTLELPPLRERLEELELLVEVFLREAREDWGIQVSGIRSDAVDALRAYDWPGNVRQLRNVIECAALAAESTSIERRHLPGAIFDRPSSPLTIDRGVERPTRASGEAGLDEKVQEYEAQLVAAALQRAGGNRPAAAKILRIPLRTLYRRIKTLNLGPTEE